MNRRQYIQAVGASVALPLTASQVTAREDGQRRPVYYTVSVPEIDTQILHISIPRELLDSSNYLWSISEGKEVALNISRESTEDEWGLLNLAVQTEDLQRVSVAGAEATRWDTLELDQLALLVSGDASHSYLGVVGNGDAISVEGVENSWSWESVAYERVRVETTSPSDLDVTATLDTERKTVPVFQMTPSYFVGL